MTILEAFCIISIYNGRHREQSCVRGCETSRLDDLVSIFGTRSKYHTLLIFPAVQQDVMQICKDMLRQDGRKVRGKAVFSKRETVPATRATITVLDRRW